ncbi:sulfatase-like hydrolase/transferase [Streptomyces virginiae]|uniref:sulfatase-like hydrolase/transferase n=1 Tax=Streptomyces virginiae TaxID=1961 RepID=UPI00367A7049
MAPVELLRHRGGPRAPDRRAGALRLQRVQRLGRHRRRRVGRPETRPRDRRPGRALAAQQGARRLPGPAVVHGRQLREPPRHHELRLRGPHPGPAPARPRPRRRYPCGGEHPRVPAALGLRAARQPARRPGRSGPGRPGVRQDARHEASGQADRTVVVFTSDHGEMAGSHGLRQKGNLAYDENFHVPFVIAHPDLAGGARTEALAASVDIAPTLLEIAGLDVAEAATRHPALKGHSLMPVLHGRPVREGILNVVESITVLDASFWFEFADPEAPGRVAAGELRPDWNKRGFLRAYSDERHTFGRYFSPLNPNRPADTEALLAENDVVLYDREQDPAETRNLAADPAHRDLVERYRAMLEDLIDA